MKQELLKNLFPHGSKSFLEANSDAGHPGPTAELERPAGHGALGQIQTKGGNPKKIYIRVTSFRKRLLDEDNLCEKFHVDCCRYAGVIPTDAPATTKIEVCQVKTLKGEDEFTRVEVFEIT